MTTTPETRPRKPCTSYFRFHQEKRSEFTRAHPGKSGAEIAKLLGRAFRNLPETEKKKYEIRAADDWRQYEKELEEYRQRNGQSPPRKRTESLTIDYDEIKAPHKRDRPVHIKKRKNKSTQTVWTENAQTQTDNKLAEEIEDVEGWIQNPYCNDPDIDLDTNDKEGEEIEDAEGSIQDPYWNDPDIDINGQEGEEIEDSEGPIKDPDCNDADIRSSSQNQDDDLTEKHILAPTRLILDELVHNLRESNELFDELEAMVEEVKKNDEEDLERGKTDEFEEMAEELEEKEDEDMAREKMSNILDMLNRDRSF